MNGSYEYYKVFYFVARYLNISKAARVLQMSQPNVTRTIKKLESELGCELFVRTNSGVILTKKGETLYKHVKEASRLLSLGEAEIAAQNDSEGKIISMGIPLGISRNMIHLNIIPSIGQFINDHPDTHLRIVSKTTPELIDDIKNGEIDIAIISTSVYNNNSKIPERIGLRFKDTVIAGNKYRDTFKEPVRLSDLMNYPIIGLPQNTETYRLYDNHSAEIGFIYRVDIEVSNYDLALSFAQNNIGIACVPEYMAAPAIAEGSVFAPQIIDKMPERRLSVYRNETSGSSASALLEDYLIKFSQDNKISGIENPI